MNHLEAAITAFVIIGVAIVMAAIVDWGIAMWLEHL